MLAIVKERPEPGIAVRECAEPTVQPGEVLVAVEGTGICGSDLHAYEWVPEYAWLTPHLPAILGHETAGKVIDSNGTDVPVGATVAVRPGITCGRCEACQRNVSHRCANRVRLGYERDGGLASFVAAPAANIYPVPDYAAHVAPLIEPLTVAVHTVKRAAPRPGGRTAVVGVGAIGLLTVEVLRAYGASAVLLVGTEDDERGGGLAVGERLGATSVVAGSDEHRQHAGTCETVIVAAGAPAAVRGAIELADRGGTVAVLGLGIGEVGVNIDTAVRRELGLLGSFASVPADWLDAVELVAAGRVTGEGIVSHNVPLEDGVEAFELLASRKARKVVIHPTGGHRS
jgi:threonine dehydrogenase-like Zn-dependent dehydrogenase